MATLTDSRLAALEKRARRAHWVERHKNGLMLAVITCFTLAGVVGGLGVGHWLGAQQERAERVTEVTRMQELLSQAIIRLGTLAPKVKQAAATVAQTADQVTDRMDGAVLRLDKAAAKADAVAARAAAVKPATAARPHHHPATPIDGSPQK